MDAYFAVERDNNGSHVVDVERLREELAVLGGRVEQPKRAVVEHLEHSIESDVVVEARRRVRRELVAGGARRHLAADAGRGRLERSVHTAPVHADRRQEAARALQQRDRSRERGARPLVAGGRELRDARVLRRAVQTVARRVARKRVERRRVPDQQVVVVRTVAARAVVALSARAAAALAVPVAARRRSLAGRRYACAGGRRRRGARAVRRTGRRAVRRGSRVGGCRSNWRRKETVDPPVDVLIDPSHYQICQLLHCGPLEFVGVFYIGGGQQSQRQPVNNGGLLLYIPSENQTVGTRVLEYLTGLLELTLQQREQ